MPKPFPDQPNLEHFRKQAKQLLRDLRAGDGEANLRARRFHPRWTGETERGGFSLHDGQLIIAREFGFSSWRRLVDAVERGQPVDGPTRNAVITGGAGFIGSHLVERLLVEGYRVSALDNLCAGSRANVAHLAADPRFELVEADVCDPSAVDTVVAEADVLFHLAAVYGRAVDIDPMECLRTNVHGTEVVLESASRHDVRFLFTSTSAVYGDLEPDSVLREDGGSLLGNTRVATWDYAVTKIVDEQMTLAHAHTHHLRATVVRLFNTVGSRQDDRTVVTRFLHQALANEDITVHGDGSQSRCFTDVRDVVGGLARLAECDDASGEVVNIGSRNEFSIGQVADLVKSTTGSDSTVESVAYDYETIPSRIPCLSKARRLIGYSAVHPVEESIREMAALADDGNSA
jgi:UDP-glucose 4-epimerase